MMYVIIYADKDKADNIRYATEHLSLSQTIKEILQTDGRIIGIYRKSSLNEILLSIVCRRDK